MMTAHRPIKPATTEPGEEPFGLDEIFFSRTDKRGVIRAGNDVFRRVSGYDWDRLIGAPHKIVRNPDMPKSLFWLMWQTIQAGKPIAAYVKNRTAQGAWYWVLAAVMPIADGYISVRIKPTSPMFAQIKSIYREVLAAEQSQALSPDKSADHLMRCLQGAGYRNYSDFMTRALDQELTGRDDGLGRTAGAQVRALNGVGSNLLATQTEQSALLAAFEALQSIPTNMRIIASRLEPSGGPISAISDNYKFASTEISRRLEAFAGSSDNLCDAMSQIVTEVLFLMGCARLLSEVGVWLKGENHGSSPINVDAELVILSQLAAQNLARAQTAMVRAEQVSGDLNQASAEVRRMMLGLDTIRVMGRVESGRLGPAGIGLAATIDQLDHHHAEIAARLQVLMDLSAAIKAGVGANQRKAS
jgi:PAS domain S-box-containing protein